MAYKLGDIDPLELQDILNGLSGNKMQQPSPEDNGPFIGGPDSSALGSFLGNVASGAADVVSAPLKALDELAHTAVDVVSPYDTSTATLGYGPIGKAGEAIQEGVSKIAAPDPNRSGDISSMLGQGLGSTLGFAAPFGLLGKLGTKAAGGVAAGLGATVGGVQQQEDYRREVKSQGKEVDPLKDREAFFLGFIPGSLEALPIARLFGRLDHVAKGGLQAAVKNTAAGTAEEALQEGIQQTAQNFIASDIVKYDPNRNLFLDTPESAAVGGGVGFMLNAAFNALGLKQHGIYGQAANQAEIDTLKEGIKARDEQAKINPVTDDEIMTPGITKANRQIKRLETFIEQNPSSSEEFQSRIDEIKKNLKDTYIEPKDKDGNIIEPSDPVAKQEAQDIITGIDVQEVENIDINQIPEPTAEPIPTKAKGIGVKEYSGKGKYAKEFDRKIADQLEQHKARMEERLAESRRKDQEDATLLRPTTEGIQVDEIPTDFPPPDDGGGISVEEIQPEEIDVEVNNAWTDTIREAANDPEMGNAHISRLNEAWAGIKTLVNTVEEAGISDATFSYDKAVKALENGDADTLEFIMKDLIKQVEENPEAVQRIANNTTDFDRKYMELMQMVADGDRPMHERAALVEVLDELDQLTDRSIFPKPKDIDSMVDISLQLASELNRKGEVVPFPNPKKEVVELPNKETPTLPEDIQSLSPQEAQDLIDNGVEGPGYAIRELEQKAKEISTESTKVPEPILTTKGKPYKTVPSANIQLKKKGLQDTHEVVPHEDGYAIVPKKEAITPQPEAPKPPQVPEPPTTITDEAGTSGVIDLPPEDKIETPLGEVEKTEPSTPKEMDADEIEKKIAKVDSDIAELEDALDFAEDPDVLMDKLARKQAQKEALERKASAIYGTKSKEESTTQKLTKEEEDELVNLDKDNEAIDFDDPLESADNLLSFTNYDDYFAKIHKNSIAKGKAVFDAFSKRIRSTHKHLPVKFITKLSDLPKGDQEWLLGLYPDGPPRGLYVTKDGGVHEVWVFARQGATKYEYARTLFHEVVGHYGIGNLFASELNLFKDNVLKNSDLASKIYALRLRWKNYDLDTEGLRDDEIMWVEDKYVIDTLNLVAQDDFRIPVQRAFKKHGGSKKVPVSKKGMRKLVEEYISEMAADLIDNNPGMLTPQEKNIMRRLLAWVKHFLRRAGAGAYVDSKSIVDKPPTDQELLYLVQESAHRILEDGEAIASKGKLLKGNELYSRVFIHMNEVYREGDSPEKITNAIAKELVKENKAYKKYTLEQHLANKTLTGKIIESSAEVEEVIKEGTALRLFTEEDARGTLKSMNEREGRIDSAPWQRRVESISDKIRRSKFGRIFASNGRLPFYKALNVVMNPAKGAIELSERGAREWYNKLHTQSDGIKKAVFEYFTTKDADPNMVPEVMRDMSVRYKQRIHEFGLRLVELGLMSQETFERHDGAYLPIMYWNWLDRYKTSSGKKISFENYLKRRQAFTDVEKEMRGQIKDPSLLVPYSIATVERDVSLHTMFSNMLTFDNVGNLGWFIPDPRDIDVGGKKMTLAEVERNIDLDEQKLALGEDTNPLYTSQDGVQKIRDHLAMLLAAKERHSATRYERGIRETIARSENIPLDQVTKEMFGQYEGEFVRINDKRFGALDKKWIRKELYDELVEGFHLYSLEGADFMSETFGPGGKAERAHQYWKAGKVVFNPPSWVRNAVGNWVLLDIGTNSSTAKLIEIFTDEFKQFASGKMSRAATIAHEWGLYGTTWTNAELGLIQNRAKDFYNEKMPDVEKEFKLVPKQFRKLKWMGAKSFHWYLEKAVNFYGGIEGFFKTIALRDHIEQWEKQNGRTLESLNQSEREAVIRNGVETANQNIFDYSKIPSWMRTTRRQPFVGAPFLTYTFKAIPQSIEGLARRPQKFIKYALFPTALAQAFMMTQDIDDDDMEYIQQNMHKWMKEKSSMFILPWKDSNGKIQVMDFGYYLPWASLHNAYLTYANKFDVNNPLSGLSSTWDVASDLGFLGGPFPSLISGLKTNKDPFTGGEIVRTAGTAADKRDDLMRYMMDLWMPTFLTSKGVLGRTLDNLGIKAATWISTGREVTAYGSDRETGMQTALRGAGVNVYGLDIKEARLTKTKEYRIERSKLIQARARAVRDRNSPPNKKIMKVKEINNQIKLLTEQFKKEMSGG